MSLVDTLHVRSGTILPKGVMAARNAAENCIAVQIGLAGPGGAGSVASVVADLPQGSGALCPHRYPSPDGRRFASLRTPLFFCRNTGCYSGRRHVAQTRSAGARAFDAGLVLAFDKESRSAGKKGASTSCPRSSENNLKQSSRPFPFWRWQHAVTASSSRRQSAVSAGLEPRLSLAAALRRAPLSARRATWPTARHSRTAATRTCRPQSGRPQSGPHSIFRSHPRHSRTDGSFRFKTQS